MAFLIPAEQLIAARERIEKREAEKSAAAGFVYQPRTAEQWQARMNQGSRKYSRPQRIPVSSVSAPGQAPAVTPKPKVTQTTLCVCGHPKKSHCAGAKSHPTESGTYWCMTTHCQSLRIENGKHVGDCECPGFRTDANAPVRTVRPKATAWTQCANSVCGHWKSHHCRVRKPSKAKKPKSRDWFGFEDENGAPHVCKHTPADQTQNYSCTSASCAEADEGGEFCACEKFINPLTKPKKSKRQSLAEVQAELSQMAERL
jgi:hypothetical protein